MTSSAKLLHATRLRIHDVLAQFHNGLANFGLPARLPVMKCILQVKRERHMETTPIDAFQIYTTARSTAKLPGAAAEVGVFKGATARLILEALPNKIVHLCDTFEGLPDSQ